MSENKETPWDVIDSRYIYKTPWFSLRQDDLRTHRGEQITYTYQEHPGVVIIIGVTSSGQIPLLWHYRHPAREWCWELPAGRIENAKSPLESARNEFHQEVGGHSDTWQLIASFYTSTGSSSEKAWIYLADNIQLTGNEPEPTELFELHFLNVQRVITMVQNGQISDGPSALALFLAMPDLLQFD